MHVFTNFVHNINIEIDCFVDLQTYSLFKHLTLDLLWRIRAERSLLDSPITPAWSLALHHSTSLSTSFPLVPSCSAASAKSTHKHIYKLSEAHFDFNQTFLPMKPCIFRWVQKIYSCRMRGWFFYGHGFSLKLGHSLPCVSMSIRNVPKSLNWTGGISECRNFNTTSATPANSILDLFTTGKKEKNKAD